MSGWVLGLPGFTELDRYNVATTSRSRATVTAHATPHTKGSWVELIASTSQDTHMLGINLSFTFWSSNATNMLVDIGVGGSGSEVVLIANMCGGWHGREVGMTIIPVYLPAGTRIAARCQALITEDIVEVGVRLLNGPRSFTQDQWQGGNVVTYGADEANSRGTFVTGGANVEGSWTEITNYTTEPHSAIGLSVQGYTNTNLTNQNVLLDIGFGAGGSEQVLLKNIMLRQTTTEQMYVDDTELGMLTIGRTLLAGSRLAVRLQFQTAADRELTLCLHGVT